MKIMQYRILPLSILFFFFLTITHPTFAAEIELKNLRCQMLTEPMGIDIQRPSFSWEYKFDKPHPGFVQQAYQLLVATSTDKLSPDKADIWNSGKVNSERSSWVEYRGPALRSNVKYYWKVLTWGQSSEPSVSASPWSGRSFFQTGLMESKDWKAKWIGLDKSFAWDSPDSTHSRLSARYFRKQLNIGQKIKKATLFFTGLGLYKLYVDGKELKDQALSPIVSDYRKEIYYNVFDLSSTLTGGKHVIGVILGNGHFFSMRPGKPGQWKEGIPTLLNFGYPKLLFQLEIEYENGQKETIVSDKTWKVTADGPIRSNNIFDGEVYDANKEMPGWATNSYDDAKWRAADYTSAPGGVLRWQASPNMKIMNTIRPIQVKKQANGKYLVDMGQNMVGWLRIKLKSSKKGTIVLRYGERLDEQGHLYTKNLRSAHVTDSIYRSSQKRLDWQPSFVYHGFRFVEISGISDLKAGDLQGEVVYDNMKSIGTFTSSDSTLNQIYKAAWWTISGNYKGMPVDCPQRDERMGWLGDRSINSYGESFLFDNYHLYAKWLDDIADAQKENGSLPDIAPGFWPGFFTDNMTWPSSFLFVSDMLYKQFGDKQVLKRHYPQMKKWMAHMLTYISADSLVEKDNYGDWCMPPESLELIKSKDSTRITPGGFIGASYYIKCLDMMAHFAGISGKKSDSLNYTELRTRMIQAINKKYFNNADNSYANNTVTANLLALPFDIVPPLKRPQVAENIARVSADKYNDHVSTGLIGDQWLMRGLTENGYADIAFKLATNTTYPSWGYMLKEGSTTIWELWNGNTADPAMNSGNHVMLLGDLLIWYYENLAGIKSAAPGFKQIEMHPLVSSPLKFVNATHESPYGTIKSHWQKNGEAFNWAIEVPANSAATVWVPAKSKASIQFNGHATYIKEKQGCYLFKIGSGSYQIKSILNL